MAAKKRNRKPVRRKLRDFVSPYVWVDQGRGGQHFDTYDKVDWLIRHHRAELIASGEYIPGRGSRGSMIGPGFDTLAVDILRRSATAA